MKSCVTVALVVGIGCLFCPRAHAEFIPVSRAFAGVTGGVDQPLTVDSHVNSFNTQAQISENTPRAKASLGEVGTALLRASAGDGRVGATVEFKLKTSGYNPDSEFHVAGAGGIAQARWDDTISLKLHSEWTDLETHDDPGGYSQYVIVRNHANYDATSTGTTDVGSAEIVDFDLRFSMDLVGLKHHSTEVGGPEAFGEANPFGTRSYQEILSLDTGYSLQDYRLWALDPLNPKPSPFSFSLEIWNQLSGRSGGDASINAHLNASQTSEILGIVFMNSQGHVAPMSSLFFAESASGTEYAILDELPGGISTVPVPEPSGLTLLGTGALGLAARRRRRTA